MGAARTINEQSRSSTLLPQFKCVTLELIDWSDPLEIDMLEAWARRDMNDMLQLVAGQESEVEIEHEDREKSDAVLHAASLENERE